VRGPGRTVPNCCEAGPLQTRLAFPAKELPTAASLEAVGL
jgi:hypothetical protein